MKLLKTFICLFLFLFMFLADDVFASTYNQGVVTSYAVVRKEPNSSASSVKNDTGGTIGLYSPESVEIIGESGSYYHIKFIYSGFIYTGYIPKSNVRSKVYNIDDNYKQQMINKGFPPDYADKLAILHAIHPNWTFEPSYTNGISGGMDFSSAVNGEADVIARNLINSSNTSLRSTDDGAYRNGEWISLSGSGWYAASRQTIAFFMDPRNFLEEGHVFMFENLGYNPATQTVDTVGKIIGNSFMNNPFECFNGANACAVGTHYYRDTFVEAGQGQGVSPVHLASRVLQEQGSGGSVLSLGKGYNNEYIGYYNFFNIAASGTTDAEVIINGLKYAMNRNWNNQHISIYEGSALISNNYVKRGQSTLYYQKFNTIIPSLFGNQYMQNVKAPYSESYSTYTGYYKSYNSVEEWNNSVYDFLIPVYSNMGNYTTLDTSGNADATLRSLSVSSCNLNPSFQSSAYTYDCYTSLDTQKVTINAEATNSLAKVDNPGEVELSSNDSSITIKVTAANGNVANYVINVHKIETDGYNPTEILNGIGIKVTGNYATNIAVGSDVSNLINSITNKHYFASVKVQNISGSEVKEGTVSTGYKVTITNAGITTSYTIVMYGDTSGDGLIDIRDLLIIQKHLVKSKTLANEYLKSADINKDGSVDIRDLLLEQKHLVKAYTISQG